MGVISSTCRNEGRWNPKTWKIYLIKAKSTNHSCYRYRPTPDHVSITFPAVTRLLDSFHSPFSPSSYTYNTHSFIHYNWLSHAALPHLPSLLFWWSWEPHTRAAAAVNHENIEFFQFALIKYFSFIHWLAHFALLLLLLVNIFVDNWFWWWCAGVDYFLIGHPLPIILNLSKLSSNTLSSCTSQPLFWFVEMFCIIKMIRFIYVWMRQKFTLQFIYFHYLNDFMT